MPSPSMLHPTLRDFERQVIHATVPILVDFWAPWCPPCRSIGPELERAAEALAGRVRVATINVDEEPELAGAYGIQSIPALILFKDGDIAGAWVGFATAESIVKRVLDRCGEEQRGHGRSHRRN